MENLGRHTSAQQIRAICFDGFGTLVEIRDKRRPFKALLDTSKPDAVAVRALTSPMSLRDVARDLATKIDEARLVALEADLAAETASTRLRPGIDMIWQRLRRFGLKLGVCSNLAAPYGDALLDCLPDEPEAVVLSFEVGLMKPQPEIYQLVCDRLGVEPHQLLFVGDTMKADVEGPRKAGLFALHITEFEAGLAEGALPVASPAVAEFIARLRQGDATA